MEKWFIYFNICLEAKCSKEKRILSGECISWNGSSGRKTFCKQPLMMMVFSMPEPSDCTNDKSMIHRKVEVSITL